MLGLQQALANCGRQFHVQSTAMQHSIQQADGGHVPAAAAQFWAQLGAPLDKVFKILTRRSQPGEVLATYSIAGRSSIAASRPPTATKCPSSC
jgi:hypothetical protein